MGRMIEYSKYTDVNEITDKLVGIVDWFKEEFEIVGDLAYANEDSKSGNCFSILIANFLATWELPPDYLGFDDNLGYVTIWQCEEFTVTHIAYEHDRWHDFVVIDVDDITAVKYKLMI